MSASNVDATAGMDQYRTLPLARRLEIRGRITFGEPMSDPNEARLAATLARRMLLWGWVALLGGLVFMFGWRIATGEVPWGMLGLDVVTLGFMAAYWRAAKANQAVADSDGYPASIASS